MRLLKTRVYRVYPVFGWNVDLIHKFPIHIHTIYKIICLTTINMRIVTLLTSLHTYLHTLTCMYVRMWHVVDIAYLLVVPLVGQSVTMALTCALGQVNNEFRNNKKVRETTQITSVPSCVSLYLLSIIFPSHGESRISP